MRYSLLLPTALLGSVLVLGCGEQPGPAEPANDPQPSLRTEQNPEGPGAQITRLAGQGIFINDPDRDFTLTIGAPISEAPECGGPGEITEVNIQVVTTPAGVENAVGRVRQATMTLYGRSFTTSPCELTEADIVAEGLGNATLVISTRPSSTLVHVQATGKVELTSGGLAHLLVVSNVVTDPEGNILRVHVDRFQLKPIGG
jgi:hypothetical protein